MNSIDYLIKMIRRGNKEYFDEVLENHKNMIFSIVNSFHFAIGDYKLNADDLFQEGSLGLYDAIFSYEDDKETKFSTYAYSIVKRRITNYVKNEYKVYFKENYSLDHDKRNYGLLVSDNNDFYKKDDMYEIILEKVSKHLSKQDYEIIKLRKENKTYKEISQYLNISPKRIDNRLSAIRKKYKKYLTEYLNGY